ncbi:peptidoglycan-binding protein [Streptomyces sp. NPDC007264]|uniref:peptidoglycan-binding protein n=1 Tax=Streptomyces sp. NPDC007264 TaxID=3364777 RepID=UPI0036D8BC41
METPVFEESDPTSGRDRGGRVRRRPVGPASSRAAGRSGGRGPTVRKAVLLAAAVGTVLGMSPAMPSLAAAHAPLQPGVPADDALPDTPQGQTAPLRGPSGAPASAALPKTTRAQIIRRAKKWVTAAVPYDMNKYWSDGYRQDCSGFVSMAWNLGSNEWTGSLNAFGVRISKEELQPGDILLFHNKSNPEKGSHVVIFGGWTDYTHTSYIAYEETPPVARRQATPYAYWSNSGSYVPYRYKGVTDGAVGTKGAPATIAGATPPVLPVPFPSAAFGPGADNGNVTRLGSLLMARGGARFYLEGPGSRWSEADRRAVAAFQRAQGWTGQAADGLPGPVTWKYLTQRAGADIPLTVTPTAGTAAVGAPGTAAPHPPALNPPALNSPALNPPAVNPAGTPATALAGPPAAQPVGKPVPRAAAPVVPGYPGADMFRPGANNPYVTRLGRQLIKKGFGSSYPQGPGPVWDEADQRAVEAFQRVLGFDGDAADGRPGPETWRRLFS